MENAFGNEVIFFYLHHWKASREFNYIFSLWPWIRAEKKKGEWVYLRP